MIKSIGAATIWFAILGVCLYVVMSGVRGESYVCPKCGFQKTYYGYYVFTTPDNYCSIDKMDLVKHESED